MLNSYILSAINKVVYAKRQCYMKISGIKIKLWSVCVLLGYIFILGCKEDEHDMPIEFYYTKPSYYKVALRKTTDTLKFPLSEDMYNKIKSFNTFTLHDSMFIAFYDLRAKSIHIYNFFNQSLLKTINLKQKLNGSNLEKITVYVKSLDTIFVTTTSKLLVINSEGAVLKKIPFVKHLAWAAFDNTTPPVLHKNTLYSAVKPYVNESSLGAIRSWKTIYKFNLNAEDAKLSYHFPEVYHENLYGYHFFDYSYCFNGKAKFVFSFPADTNIYATNFLNVYSAYNGKSRFQKKPIVPLKKEDIKSGKSFEEYLARDSYGPIYYDPYRKTYLRLFKQGSDSATAGQGKIKRKESIIFFDAYFQIVAECENEGGFHFDSMIFLKDGKVYARTKGSDEYAINFIRLEYNGFEEMRRIQSKKQ